eukprot:scaffold19823_cov74-Cyclotella_meneghiniana.AAC.6
MDSAALLSPAEEMASRTRLTREIVETTTMNTRAWRFGEVVLLNGKLTDQHNAPIVASFEVEIPPPSALILSASERRERSGSGIEPDDQPILYLQSPTLSPASLQIASPPNNPNFQT